MCAYFAKAKLTLEKFLAHYADGKKTRLIIFYKRHKLFFLIIISMYLERIFVENQVFFN